MPPYTHPVLQEDWSAKDELWDQVTKLYESEDYQAAAKCCVIKLSESQCKELLQDSETCRRAKIGQMAGEDSSSSMQIVHGRPRSLDIIAACIALSV